MASFSSLPAILCLTLWVSVMSPVLSHCEDKLNGKHYANCTDLPTLDAHLHYTYNASNSSLSVAFVASPEKPEGWISWAINPTGTGMVGSQAFIAFRSKDSLVVKTYNISSYHNIDESKLSFDFWDLKAETVGTDGSIAIFAAVKVPEKLEKLNQVWQVGAQVTDGRPAKHAFASENLSSKAELHLTDKAAQTTSPAPAPHSSSGNDTGGYASSRPRILGIYLGLFSFAASFIIL